MAERHNMRQRSDGRNADRSGSSGRRSMFYVPGEASDFESHRRDSARYSSTTRRSREGRTGASSRPLPASASVKPVRVGLIAGLAFLLVCAFVLVGFVLASNSGGSANRATEAMQVIETSEKVATGVEAVGGVGVLHLHLGGEQVHLRLEESSNKEPGQAIGADPGVSAGV